MVKRDRGYQWQKTRTAILKASDICHVCGEPGADAVDHVVPLARGGTDARSNLRPIHHTTPNSQGLRCNLIKSSRDYAPIIRRSGSLT